MFVNQNRLVLTKKLLRSLSMQVKYSSNSQFKIAEIYFNINLLKIIKKIAVCNTNLKNLLRLVFEEKLCYKYKSFKTSVPSY